MKHYLAKIGSFFIVAMIIFASVSTAFAEDTLKINDAKDTVKKGDTVHFTLNLADTRENVAGFELRLFYDPKKLEFVKDSIKSESFDTLFCNPSKEGKINLQWTDLSNPVNCSDKTEIFSCDFKAIDGGDAEISYFVTELFGENNNNSETLKSFSWTYDLATGDDKIVSDGVLPISKDPDTLANRQSKYINYVDGKGEENSPNRGNHESVVGNRADQNADADSNVVDVTKDNSGTNPWIFVAIAVPVIIALIVVAIILAKRKNKESDDDFDDDVDEPKFDLNAEQQAMEEAGEIDDDDDNI